MRESLFHICRFAALLHVELRRVSVHLYPLRRQSPAKLRACEFFRVCGLPGLRQHNGHSAYLKLHSLDDWLLHNGVVLVYVNHDQLFLGHLLRLI